LAVVILLAVAAKLDAVELPASANTGLTSLTLVVPLRTTAANGWALWTKRVPIAWVGKPETLASGMLVLPLAGIATVVV
jgi:hypothetical protein